MKKLLYVLILVSLGIKITGQTVPEKTTLRAVHSVSFGIGLSYTALKSETVSPLIFSSIGMPKHLTYRRESAVSKQYVQLQYQAQTLKSPFDFPIEEMGGQLVYGYLRKVKSTQNSNLYVGAEVQLQGADRQMPKSLNSAFTIALNSLNLSGLWAYSVGKHRFESHLAVAVLGYNLRSESNLSNNFNDGFLEAFKSQARFESLPKYLNTTFQATYFLPSTSKHFHLRFDYSGNCYRFKQRQFFGVLQHQLSTSLTYQF